jgi:hypothetical protein
MGEGVQWALDTLRRWERSAGERKLWMYIMSGARERIVVV